MVAQPAEKNYIRGKIFARDADRQFRGRERTNMSEYRQDIFYGIYNPKGDDVIEGMDFFFTHKDGQEIYGRLVAADCVTFRIFRYSSGKEERYTYAEIEEIVEVG